MNKLLRRCLTGTGILMAAASLAVSTPTMAAPGYDQVGKATVKDVGSYAMTPIPGSLIPDGTYPVEVRTSSSFFKIEKAELQVQDGQMQVLMYMATSSYSHLYLGTAEEAAAAEMEDYIPSEEIDYYATFTIPVDGLNHKIPCAAFSKKKKKWYTRYVVVPAASLPADVLELDLPDYDLINDALAEYVEAHPEAEAVLAGEATAQQIQQEGSEDAEEPEGVTIAMPDGEYSIETALAGGSGRASVTSPTWFYVREGQAYAKLLWSSSYYDYMILDGKKYLNETTDGSNSTFTIPVTAMDEPIAIVADTTAMGDPVAIEYTLTFYKDTIGSKNQVPQEGAKHVILLAFIVMIGGGILNHYVKSRKKQ